ncbi:hypothetical protein B296_00044270 [Ensete ventricosum]|uniref:Uncharacterized protein n=1 Tax=Ensete ventricosum TaxID=4639 RepID=A0A426ZBJ0_ENSVE|nr:hypothetical protein B296_00044270 [Ensete ventricosum]
MGGTYQSTRLPVCGPLITRAVLAHGSPVLRRRPRVARVPPSPLPAGRPRVVAALARDFSPARGDRSRQCEARRVDEAFQMLESLDKGFAFGGVQLSAHVILWAIEFSSRFRFAL